MTDFAFQGNGVALRPFEPEDVPALEVYLNHPDLAGRRYVPWGFPELPPLARGQVEALYRKWAETKKGLKLAVVQRESGELVGHAGCDWSWDPHCPDVTVVIAPTHQRQGYGSEALSLLLHYLFETTVAHSISGWIAEWNTAGVEFATRHGFRECGRLRRAGVRHGVFFDVIVADMLRREWQPGGGTHHGA
jgi:RimJ/RimL family protein N-acetyltransferase